METQTTRHVPRSAPGLPGGDDSQISQVLAETRQLADAAEAAIARACSTNPEVTLSSFRQDGGE